MELHQSLLASMEFPHPPPPPPPPQPPRAEMEEELRRGPWTVEEDLLLIKYVTEHGEGRWNAVARCAGLKRTGKSCRLRWLNYLRPDVRRGNITPEEQLLIFELHARWGNRWSKIARFLPGRTDNEIKNYWRTRVQKHAKQLPCDANSKTFRDAMRSLWIPRLIDRVRAASHLAAAPATVSIPPPPCSAPWQPETSMISWTAPLQTAAGTTSSTTSNSSEEPFLPTQLSSFFAPGGCYSTGTADAEGGGGGGGMGKCDVEEEGLAGVGGGGVGWSDESTAVNYGDLDEVGWAATGDSLLPGDWGWSVEEMFN
ncbi:hypothetical protein Cni_G27913 [Canna indica]|uniref:Uncharacterized protein n=1 Tax=Canna indica TaxID=4628 RepID=A0AAQ3QND3_9LILI|nr:hypothetical protein Cni_G27913 [Canna indica]